MGLKLLHTDGIGSSRSRRLEAPILLLTTGGLVGAVFPVTVLARQAGVSPLGWALAMMLGAGLVLMLAAWMRRQPLPLGRHHLRYYLVSGLVSMALPNLILFSVLPRLGSGLSAIVYTLPPLFTLAFATLLRLERPGLRRMAGIGLGLVGALMIVGPRGSLPSPALHGWMALAFAIPVSVALGNVYRTRAWPAGARPLPLAAGMLLGAAAWVVLAMLVTGSLGDIASVGGAPGLAVVQIFVTAFSYVLFFRLQKVAGPVYLSQIGYVVTATGLVFGSLMFGERYSLWVWGAVAVILAGIALVNSSQGRRW